MAMMSGAWNRDRDVKLPNTALTAKTAKLKLVVMIRTLPTTLMKMLR